MGWCMCEKNPLIRLGRVARRFHGGGGNPSQKPFCTNYALDRISYGHPLQTERHDGLVDGLNALGEGQLIGPGLLVTCCQSCANKSTQEALLQFD